MWRYDAAANRDKPTFTHGSHALEVVWSILPAATLVFIAIYQMNAWADAKMRRPKLASGALKPPLAEITGRQRWRPVRGEDGEVGTEDDIQLVNDLHCRQRRDCAVNQSLMLHSFSSKYGVKQDLVPGMKQLSGSS
jgi:cytochrome c oxidase subunit 2